MAVVWGILFIVVHVASGSSPEGRRSRFQLQAFGLAIIGLAGASLVALTAPRPFALEFVLGGATVLFIFFLTASLPLAAIRDLPRHFIADSWFLLSRRTTWLGAFGVALVFAGTAFRANATPKGPSLSEFQDWFFGQPRIEVPTRWVEGGQPVIAFLDYKCPACRNAAQYYDPMWRELASLSLRPNSADFPLDRECNNIVVRGHEGACAAAVAARLARARGKGREMEDWLWQHQSSFTRETVLGGAREVAMLEITEDDYSHELSLLKGDVAMAAALGVKGTPTYIVHGVLLSFVPRMQMEWAIKTGSASTNGR